MAVKGGSVELSGEISQQLSDSEVKLIRSVSFTDLQGQCTCTCNAEQRRHAAIGKTVFCYQAADE